MTDLARLGLQIEHHDVDAADRSLDKFATTAGKAQKATGVLTAESGVLNRATALMVAQIAKSVQAIEKQISALNAAGGAASRYQQQQASATAATARAGASAQAAATHFDNLFDEINRDFSAQYVAQMGRVGQAHAKGAVGARLQSYELTNLGRQFADVGVQAAMGMSPLLILIQQGPQIADVFATAAARGVGFKAVLAGIGGMLAPLLPILLAIAAVVGTVAAGFGLLHRELSKGYPKDITDGLGLTEAQLDRVKHKTVTFGDTVAATFTVIGRHIMAGPVGNALRWLGDRFGDLMNFITGITVSGVAKFIAFWIAGGQTVVQNWRKMPAAMADAVTQVVNTSITGIEGMINTAIAGLNKLIAEANKLPAVNLKTVGSVSLPHLANPNAGAAASFASDVASGFSKNFAEAESGVLASMAGLAKEIRDEAIARARRRALKEAGKAGKGAADPRDMTDERDSQVASALAQAQGELLRAQQALSKDVQARADIEKQIIDQALAEKQAGVDRQIAAIQDDKGLTDAKKAELIAQLDIVAGLNKQTADLQKRKVDEDTADALRQEALKREQAGLDIQADALRIAGDMADTAKERRAIELRLLDLADQREAAELQAIIALNATTEADRQIAQARLEALRATRGAREQVVIDRNLSPFERAINDNTDPSKMAEQNSQMAAQSFDRLAESLASAAMNAQDLGKAVSDWLKETATELLAMNLKRGAAAVGQKLGVGVADQAQQAAAAASAAQAISVAITTSAATAGTSLSAAVLTGGEAAGATLGGAITSAGGVAGTVMGGAIVAAAGQAAVILAGAVAGENVAGGGGGSFPQLPMAATGGLIQGPGTGTSDSVLARLDDGGFLRVSNGEFIVNAEATRKHIGLLRAINDNQSIPRMADGGSVGPPVVSTTSHGSGGNVIINNHGQPMEAEVRRNANGDTEIDMRPMVREGVRQGVRQAHADGSAARARRLEPRPVMRA